MKVCRYQESAAGPVKLGVVRGDMVHDVTAVTDSLPCGSLALSSGRSVHDQFRAPATRKWRPLPTRLFPFRSAKC